MNIAQEDVSEKLIEKYVRLLQSEVHNGDPEIAHLSADELLCNLLEELGYKKVTDVYNQVDKWYA